MAQDIQGQIVNTAKTTITLTTSHTRATISVPHGEMTMEEMIYDLIRPALIAVGYHPDNVDDYICKDGEA